MYLLNHLATVWFKKRPPHEEPITYDSNTIPAIVVLSVVSLVFAVFIVCLLIAAFKFNKARDDNEVICKFLCDKFEKIIKSKSRDVEKYETIKGNQIYICYVKDKQDSQDEKKGKQ